jgi:hypothetical protein
MADPPAAAHQSMVQLIRQDGRSRPGLAAGASAVEYITRTAHSEALIVSGKGDDVDHFDQPRARLPLRADSNLSARKGA